MRPGCRRFAVRATPMMAGEDAVIDVDEEVMVSAYPFP